MLTVLAPGLVFALAASAQQPVAPPSPAVESVIVTAPALRTEKALDNFIISHAAPSPWLRKIARWKVGICPVTIGLPDKLGLYVTQRIIRIAMMAGAPLDSHEPCRPNVAVLVTPQPQVLVDFIRAKRPALLGYHYRSQADRIATMKLPIQAWYSTATEDFWGFLEADSPAFTQYIDAPKNLHVTGNRTGDGLKSEFTTAIIVVDSGKIAGQQIGALADYIGMLALSQAQSYDACQDVPTINNLMAPGCDASMKPDALTDIDLTYLRGLYKMDAGNSYIGERSSIAFAMKKDLGGY